MISSRLSVPSAELSALPVMFPPGRATLRTSPHDSGSGTPKKTIGMVCVASRSNATVGDRMIMNAAFLVDRGREAAFDKRLQEIAKEHAGLSFQLTGPWPPYNFVAIRLKREGAGEQA